MPFLDSAVRLAPKIRGPIQLAGFIFSVFCGAMIYRVDPGNVASLTITGAIGVALIVIPLTFRPDIIEMIQKAHRGWFLLAMVALLLTSFGALAYVTAPFIWTPTPKGARFDSALVIQNVRFTRLSASRSRAELEWELFPLTKDTREGATIFTGIVVLHDDSETGDGIGVATDAACEEVPSCVGSHVFTDFSKRPVFVRGGAPRVPLRVPVDFRGDPRTLRVWWEFYQREGDGEGLRCGVDHDRAAPKQGVPPLAMYNSQNVKVGAICYNSTDQVSIPVIY